jgi:hypothetical protein
LTINEYKTLLDLSNSWQAAADQFEKSKTNNGMISDHHQKKGDLRLRNVYTTLAAQDETRAKVWAHAAKTLARKLAELFPGGGVVTIEEVVTTEEALAIHKQIAGDKLITSSTAKEAAQRVGLAGDPELGAYLTARAADMHQPVSLDDIRVSIEEFHKMDGLNKSD